MGFRLLRLDLARLGFGLRLRFSQLQRQEQAVSDFASQTRTDGPLLNQLGCELTAGKAFLAAMLGVALVRGVESGIASLRLRVRVSSIEFQTKLKYSPIGESHSIHHPYSRLSLSLSADSHLLHNLLHRTGICCVI